MLKVFIEDFLFINFNSTDEALKKLKEIFKTEKLSEFLGNDKNKIDYIPESAFYAGSYYKPLVFLYKATAIDFATASKTKEYKLPTSENVQYLCEAVFQQLSEEKSENQFVIFGGIDLLLQMLHDEQEFKGLNEKERNDLSKPYNEKDSPDIANKKYRKKFRDNFLKIFQNFENQYEILTVILNQNHPELFEAYGESCIGLLKTEEISSEQIHNLLKICILATNVTLFDKAIVVLKDKLPWDKVLKDHSALLLEMLVDRVIKSKNLELFERQVGQLVEKLPLEKLDTNNCQSLMVKLTEEVVRLFGLNGKAGPENRKHAFSLFEKSINLFLDKLPVDTLEPEHIYKLLSGLVTLVLEKNDYEIFEKCLMPLLLKLPLSKMSSDHCFNLLNPLKDKILKVEKLETVQAYALPMFEKLPVENLTKKSCYKLLKPVMHKVVTDNNEILFTYAVLPVLRRIEIDADGEMGLTTNQCINLVEMVLKSKNKHRLFASCVIPILERLPKEDQAKLTKSFIKEDKTKSEKENKFFTLLKSFVEEQHSRHFHNYGVFVLEEAVKSTSNRLSPEDYKKLLKLAIEKNNIEIAMTLFSHADKYSEDRIERGLELLNLIFSKEFKYDCPIFADFIFIESPELLSHVDEKGNDWLHRAASKTGALSHYLISNPTTIEKINLNQRNKEEETALHIAVKSGNIDLVRKLIHSGVNIWSQDNNRQTAHDIAKNLNQYEITQVFDAILEYKETQVSEYQCENLFLRGGGVKGYAYLSGLEAFDKEITKLSSILRVAGSSAGAITATLVAFNFAIDELKTKLENKNLKDFLDGSPKDSSLLDEVKALAAEGANFNNLWVTQKASFLSRAKALIDKIYATLDTQQGLESGENFRKWLIETIAEKIGNTSLAWKNGVKIENFDPVVFAESITFEEMASAVLVDKNGNELLGQDRLPQKAFKELYVYGTNIATKMPILFSPHHTPNACVVDAVRISMAFPFVFAPWQIYIKENGQRILDPKYKDIKFSDGGIFKNFAPNTFDFDPITGTYRYNPKTIGFNLVNQNDKDYYEHGIISDSVSTNTLFSWLGGIFGSLLGSEAFIHAESQDHERTIYIEVHVSSMSFDIIDKEKDELSESARAGIQDFKNRSKVKTISVNLSPETVANLVKFGILEQANHRIFSLSQRFKLLDPKNVLALYAQAKEDEIWLLLQLVNPHLHRDENNNTAMHIARAYGFENVLKRFRKLHCDMSLLNKMGHPSDMDEDHVQACLEQDLPQFSRISEEEKAIILKGELASIMQRERDNITRINELEAQIRDLKIDFIQADGRLKARDTEVAQLKNEKLESAAKISGLEAQLAEANRKLEEREAALVQLSTEKSQADSKISDLEAALTEVGDTLKARNAEVTQLKQVKIDEVNNAPKASDEKDKVIGRLTAQLAENNKQLQTIAHRVQARLKTTSPVGIALSKLEALLATESAEAEKIGFLAIHGRNKSAKVIALDELIEQLRTNNMPASDIIELINGKHKGVLTSGLISHRTKDHLDALIRAEVVAFAPKPPVIRLPDDADDLVFQM